MHTCAYTHCLEVLFVCVWVRKAKYILTTFLAFPGGMLAVNYLDATQKDFSISYQYLNTSNGLIHNTIQYRSIQGSDNWLKGKGSKNTIMFMN